MDKDLRPLYIKDIIDMLDYNRDRALPVGICEDFDEGRCTMNTSSIALDLMKDMEVDSISIEDGMLVIWLHDNSTCEYWEKHRHRADKRGGSE